MRAPKTYVRAARAALLCLGLAGCARPQWDRARSIAEAEAFMTPTTYYAQRVYDAAGRTFALPTATAPRRAVRSFGVPDEHPLYPVLAQRSFAYDDALALLASLGAGRHGDARALGDTLAALVTPRGEVGFSFELDDRGFYDRDYVRSGTVAWVGYGLARYELATRDPRFRVVARRITDGLLAARVTAPGDPRAGLVQAGRGRWVHGYERFDRDFLADYCVAEHQFDVWFLLRAMAALAPDGPYAAAADALGARIMATLWLPEGRFAAAVGVGGVIDTAALDAAGAWGALFLLARGDADRARAAMRYVRATFAVQVAGLDGYAPFAGAVTDHPGTDFSRMLSGEGTAAVAIALLRLGERAEAEHLAASLTTFQAMRGGGLTYAFPEAPEFPDLPAVASTAWLLFLQRELAGGAPVVFAPTP